MTVPDKDCPFARRKLLTVWVQLRVRRQCVCVCGERGGWVEGVGVSSQTVGTASSETNGL